MKKIITVLISFFVLLNIYAQDIKQDFVNTTCQYSSVNTCIIQLEIDAYGLDKKLSYQVKGEFKKDNNLIYQAMNNNVYLLNGEFSILVLKDENEIIFNKYDKTTNKEKKEFNIDDYSKGLEELILEYDSLKYLGNVNGYKSYFIYTSKSSVLKTFVSFDVETQMVSEIIYEYNKENVYNLSSLHLKFQNSIHIDFSNATFSEGQFIKKIKDKYIGVGEYKEYKVINNNKIE